MLKAGVIGYPVKHSLSPKLHSYWLRQLRIEGEYVAKEVKPEDLLNTIKTLSESGFIGVNLTIPHKKHAIPMLDEIDDVARDIGAVNTIVVKSGKLIGSNTDAYGFSENIRPHLSKKRSKAVVLGAGGAAPAVIYALRNEQFEKIIVLNRTEEKSHEIANLFGGLVEVAAWDKRSTILEGADLLVNTTSLGMAGKEPLDIDLSALPKHALVTDIIYTPLITPLLAAAKARGKPVVDGLGMLIYQAVPGFEAWFGKKPEVTPQSLEQLKQMLLS
jgi:shikimate dehydrogenase